MVKDERPDHPTDEVRVTVDAADVRGLWDWLRGVPELRGRLRLADSPAPQGTMGVPLELAVALAAATPATVAAFAGAVSTWLKQRKSDVTVNVIDRHGRQVSLSAHRIDDPVRLLRSFLAPLESGQARENIDRQIDSGLRRADEDTSA